MKGQVSTELLVIIAVVLVIFIPLLVLAYVKSNETNQQISGYQAELVAFRLAYMANSVGALGSGTSISSDVYVPAGVTEFSTRSVGNGGEIVIKTNTPSGVTETAEVVRYPIDNPKSFSTAQGWAKFNITSVYSGGVAKVRIDTAR